MSNPTLALGISAPGVQQVLDMANAVNRLRTNLQELKAIAGGQDLSGLGGLERQLKSLRVDLRKGFDEFKTMVSQGAVASMKAVEQAVTTSTASLQAKMREEQTNLQRTINDVAEKTARAQAQAGAKIKVAAAKVDLGGGLTASISGNGLKSISNVEALKKQLDELPRVLTAGADKMSKAALDYRIKLMVGNAKMAEAMTEAAEREAKAKRDWIIKMQVGSAKLVQAEAEAADRESKAKLSHIIKMQLGSYKIAEAANEAEQREAKAKLGWIIKMQAGSAKLAEAQAEAAAREEKAKLSHIIKMQLGSYKIAEAANEAAAKEEKAKLGWIIKMQAGSAKIAESILQAAEREAKAKRDWIIKMQVGSAKIAEEQAKAAEKEYLAAVKAAEKIALADKTLDAAYLASSQRAQVRLAMRARAQLDRGIDVDTVDRRFGFMATDAALNASSLAALRAQYDALGNKAKESAPKLASFRQELNDGHSAARGFASGLNALWLTWGNLAPLLAGAAVSHSFVQTIKLGAQVQHSFEVIRVLSEETLTSVGSLYTMLLDLGRNGPVGPMEIAEAMKTLSLAGLEAHEVYAATKDVLNFAVAGTTTIKQAADVMTSVGTAFKVSAEGYNYVGDVVAKTAAISKSSVESIGEAFKTASVINAQYGASLEDVGVGLALLSNLGIQGTSAGTALRNMYTDIMGRTPKVRAALKELGVDAFDAAGKARPLVDLFKDLDKNLAKFTPKSQFRLLQDIFSERGGKEAIAVLEAIRKKAETTRTDVASYLEELRLKLENAAGFMAVAAANLSLTPLNQMKSVMATLQTTFVATFDSLQPYVIDTSNRLKQLFNTPEFQHGLERMVVGLATLTEAIVKNLDVLTLLGAAWVGMKIFNGISAMVMGSAQSLAAYSLSVNKATADTVRLTAAQEAQMLVQRAQAQSTVVGAGATAAAAASLGTVLSVGARFIPWIGAAITAWQLYSFWSDSAVKSNDTYAGSSHTALLDALKKEGDRLHAINEARALGITLQEMEMRQQGRVAMADIEKPVQKARDDLEKLRSQRSRTGNETATAMRLDAQIKKQEVEVERQLTIMDGKRLELQVAQNRVATEAQEIKNAEMKAAAERQKDLMNRQRSFGNVDQDYEFKGPGGKGGFGSKASFDNELSTIEALLKKREDVLKNAYDNERKLLDAKHKSELISEGTYQAEVLRQTEGYENSVRSSIEEATQKYAAAFEARKTELSKSIKDSAKLQSALSNLENDRKKFEEGQQAHITKVNADATARQNLAVIALNGETQKLVKTSEDYWTKAEIGIKREAAVAKVRADLAGASEEVRARAEAEIKVEETHAAHIEKLREEYVSTERQLLDFATSLVSLGPPTAEGQRIIDALADRVAKLGGVIQTSKDNLDKLKQTAGDAAVLDIDNKRAEQMRKSIEDMSKTVTDKLADAVLNGGKDGFKSLRDWAKDFFLRQPLKVILQGVFQPIGNMVGNFASNALGLGSFGGSNPLMSMGSNYLMGKMGITGPGSIIDNVLGQFGFGSGIAGTASSSAEIASTVANTAAELEALGATAAEASEAAAALGQSMTTTTGGGGFGALSGALPFAALLAPIFAAWADGFFDGEQRKGGGYAYSGGAVAFTGGPSGGDSDSEGSKLAITSTVNGLNQVLKAIGLDLSVKTFQAGWETSEAGRGGVFAGGTLSDGRKFGEAGAGSNYDYTNPMNSKFDFWSDFNGDPAKFALDLKQAALEALQVVAGAGPAVVLKELTEAQKGQVSNVLNASGGGAEGSGVEGFDPTVMQGVNFQKVIGEMWTRVFDAGSLAAADAAKVLPQRIWSLIRGVDFEAKTEAEVDAIVTKISEMATAVQSFRTVVDALPVKELRAAGFDVAVALGEVAGGMDKFLNGVAAYAENFFSDAEKRAQAIVNIQKTLAAGGMNFNVDTIASATRTQFRSLVESLDLTTKNGQTAYAALMSVAGAFASITETVAGTTLESLKENVTDAHQALVDVLTNEISELDDSISRWKDFGKTLRDLKRDLLFNDTLSPLTPKQKYEEAARIFEQTRAKAMAGDETAMGQLAGAAQTFLETSREYNASGGNYMADFSRVQAVLAQGVSRAGEQAGILMAQKTIMEQQLAAIQGTQAATLTVAQAITNLATAMGAYAAAGGNPGSVVPGTGSVGGVYQSSAGGVAVGNMLYAITGGQATVSQVRAQVNSAISTGNFRGIYDTVKASGFTLGDLDTVMGWTGGTSASYAQSQGWQVFANGGAFTNGIVTKPTAFPIGMMGEKTAEAVMPLVNIGGSLGVRAAQDQVMVQQMQILIREVQELKAASVQGTKAVIASNYDANDQAAQTMVQGNAKAMERIKYREKMGKEARPK